MNSHSYRNKDKKIFVIVHRERLSVVNKGFVAEC